ncbi:HD domain-containing protein [Sulfuricella sp. T08]|uniref:HD domain-containing protein n=1 Tax=Sulfuricella sp. T08 TaxID=1632857 RepID=UPI003528BC21
MHAHQRRKGGEVPYVSHLLAVSVFVMEQDGSEDEAIGALLHDSVEGCVQHNTSDSRPSLR